MKRILAIFATIAILGAFAAGCGGDDTGGENATPPPAQGGTE